MNTDIYRELRKGIGKHSAYFQATPSGVEIDILKKLFTEQEAQIYLNLTENLETAQQIADRAKQEPQAVSDILQSMTQKGLLFPKHDGDTYYYIAAPFAHGILEHQVVRIDKELAQQYEDYVWEEKIPDDSHEAESEEFTLPLRSIPIKTPVKLTQPVALYEDVKELIKKQDRIALTKCFCAVQQQILGSDCKQPLEVCMLLGFYAEYYIELGWGRSISQEEALEVLDVAEEAGLVHQIPDSQDPGAICNCCPDCCGELRMVKLFPNPAALKTTGYYSEVDTRLCSGCELCVDRCPMSAISITPEAVSSINLEMCIGCGLCINSCPDGALTIVTKPIEAHPEPPFTNKFMRSSQDIEGTIK